MSARDDRYNRSAKGRARTARYDASEKGRATKAQRNARRVGTHAHDYVGMAPTPEIARDLNDQMRQFAANQKGSA